MNNTLDSISKKEKQQRLAINPRIPTKRRADYAAR
jgi:hypothetical protein